MITAEKMNALYEDFRDAEKALLGIKAEDYATETDRLWNFNIIAPLQGIKPSEVCAGYLLKHMVTIVKAVKEGSGTWAWEAEKGEGLKQRIADARNYLLLLAACLEEERTCKEEEEAQPHLPGE